MRNGEPPPCGHTGVAVVNAGRCTQTTDLELHHAHLLARMGLTVYVLIDDGVLEHWDSSQVHSVKYYSPYRAKWQIRWPAVIRRRLMTWAYRTGDFHVLPYSAMIGRDTNALPVDSRDESYAISSTKRFFVTGVLDLEGEHAEYYAKTVRNCAVSRAVGEYVRDVLRPNLYLSSHCIYSVWGPAYNVIKEAGIPILEFHVLGNVKESFQLTDQYIQRLSESTDWQEFNRRTVEDVEVAALGKAVLDKRVNHEMYDVKEYYPEGVESADVRPPEQSDGGKVFAMFPNVIWDGDLPERNIMFNNVIEWCTFTVDALRDTRHRLCIRFHPAEDTRHRGSLKLEEILRQRIPDLDRIPNLTIIGSGVKLDTYSFARQHVDVGLIYDGTLCLELTHLGIPVIACTNGLFTLDEVAYKPATCEEYRQWLRSPEIVTDRFAEESETRMACARRYAHWFFDASLFTFEPIKKPYPVVMDYGAAPKDAPLCADQGEVCERLIRALGDQGHPATTAVNG